MNWIAITKLLLSGILLLWFWKRFFNQLFAKQKTQLLPKRLLILESALLVGIFVGLDWLLRYFDFPSLKTELTRSSSAFSFWYFSVVLAIFPLLFALIKNKKIWLQILLGLGILLLPLLTAQLGILSSGVLYRILFASAEELFKFSSAHLHYEKQWSTSISALLLLAMLIAFAFSISETALALALQLFNTQSISSSFLLGRGFITPLIHIIATGSISLIILKNRGKNQILTFTSALVIGFLLHSSYNLALHFEQGRIGAVMAIGGFFPLSYLLYHLDELYLPPEKVEK